MDYNIDIDDYIGRWGFSKLFVKDRLSECKNKPCNVRINSLGGSLDDGLSIMQQFRDHGNVTAYLYGYVASSATVIAMGANRVCMSKYGFFLAHKVMNWVNAWDCMNADQIQQLIDDLTKNKLENDKMDQVLASLYADKCKKKPEDILDLLKEGRWMTAYEAKEMGFVDEIIEEGEKLNFTPSLAGKFNRIGLPDLPHGGTAGENGSEETGILSKIKEGVDALANVFNIKNNNQTITTMEKKFAKVNAILNLEGIEVKDGKINLDMAQMEAIENKISDLEKQNTQLESEKTNLTTEKTGWDTEKTNLMKEKKDLQDQVDALNGGAGDKTTDLHGGDETGKEDVTAVNMFNSVKNLV